MGFGSKSQVLHVRMCSMSCWNPLHWRMASTLAKQTVPQAMLPTRIDGSQIHAEGSPPGESKRAMVTFLP